MRKLGRTDDEYCGAALAGNRADAMRHRSVWIPLRPSNPMRASIKCIAVRGWLLAAVAGTLGCAPKPIAPMTVAELMDDRVTLDGVLMKCNEDPVRARNDGNCRNARTAVERLANDVDPAEVARRKAEFERRREMLRLAQEKARLEQAEKAKVDAYSLPVVPVEPPPPAPPIGNPPGLAQTKH